MGKLPTFALVRDSLPRGLERSPKDSQRPIDTELNPAASEWAVPQSSCISSWSIRCVGYSALVMDAKARFGSRARSPAPLR